MSFQEKIYRVLNASQLHPRYRGQINAVIATGDKAVTGYFAPGKDFDVLSFNPDEEIFFPRPVCVPITDSLIKAEDMIKKSLDWVIETESNNNHIVR